MLRFVFDDHPFQSSRHDFSVLPGCVVGRPDFPGILPLCIAANVRRIVRAACVLRVVFVVGTYRRCRCFCDMVYRNREASVILHLRLIVDLHP